MEVKFSKETGRLPTKQNYALLVSSAMNCFSEEITWIGPCHSGMHSPKNITKSGIILWVQSHLKPNQEFKCDLTEEDRSIIPVLQTNTYRLIKQHFYSNSSNSCKSVTCFNTCADKSLLPGKKWRCHRGACGYFTGNICALGSREAVQGRFICIVAVQCGFSQALSTSLCDKLRYLKTEKNKNVII